MHLNIEQKISIPSSGDSIPLFETCLPLSLTLTDPLPTSTHKTEDYQIYYRVYMYLLILN